MLLTYFTYLYIFLCIYMPNCSIHTHFSSSHSELKSCCPAFVSTEAWYTFIKTFYVVSVSAFIFFIRNIGRGQAGWVQALPETSSCVVCLGSEILYFHSVFYFFFCWCFCFFAFSRYKEGTDKL